MYKIQKYLILITISLILILSVYFIFYFYLPEDEMPSQIDDDVSTIIDIISPENSTQGIFVEIQRIHRKGIEEEFRKIGNSWKKKPLPISVTQF